MHPWTWILAAGLGGYFAVVTVANRAARPMSGPLELTRAANLPTAGRDLTVFNWNLGYAGLGRESDFVADGGSSWRAPRREIAARNLDGIKRAIAAANADVLTLQEITITSPLNYWQPMWTEIEALRSGADRVFVGDVVSSYVPRPLRLEHGLATFSNVRVQSAEAVPLPLEPDYWLGILKKLYVLVVTRIPIAGDQGHWLVVNLHHAAYDTGGTTRKEQVAAVMAFGEQEYKKGNYVVMAGDWNMLLNDRKFPHETDPKLLDWAQPFPQDMLRPGWQIISDPDVPTVRQLDRPYEKGRNFVAMIDGFLASPNVSIENVQAIDLQFANSDHHPIVGRFHAKTK